MTAAARGSTIDVMHPRSSGRRIPLVAALALLVLVTTAATATAAARFPMTFDYTASAVVVRHEWTELDRDWPEKCRSWVKGRGFVEQKAAAGGGTLRVDDNGAYLYGLTSEKLRGGIERVITYRGHSAPTIAECAPCGATEYGPCREERPDVIWHDTCGPRDGRFELNLLLTGSALFIRPGMDDQDILDHCEEVEPAGVLPGPSSLYVDSVKANGAGRALTRLKVGGRKTIRFRSRRGRCTRIGRVGEHACETVKATLVFRRTT
jgi:hypothetical protein